MLRSLFCALLVVVVVVDAATVLDVTKYGAKGDGSHKNTAEIAKAIAEAHSHKATVHFPSGHYLTGPIKLLSDVTLDLASGAVIKFSDDPHDYTPLAKVHSDGIDKIGFVPLISAEKATNVGITGSGTLDGSGSKWWALRKQWKSAHPGERTKDVNVDHVTKVEQLFDSSHHLIHDISPPRFFVAHHSSHVTLKGVKIENSPFLTVIPSLCDHVTIDHVKISNPHDAPNTDGIDPSSSKHVIITGCEISVGDDCIALKASHDGATENVTITDSVMHSGHGGFVIGSTTAGGIHNIRVKNLHFEGTDRGIRIKTARGYGGYVRDIHVQNITMKGITHEGITINAMYDAGAKPAPAGPANEKTPVIEDITIEDVHGDAKIGIEIVGLPEKHFNKITLKNVHITSHQKAKVENVDHMVMTNVTESGK